MNHACTYVQVGIYCELVLSFIAERTKCVLLCAEGGHLAVAEYLAPKMEGHLFDSDVDGHTILHLAAYFGQLSMVKHLVKSCGLDLEAKDKVGP